VAREIFYDLKSLMMRL